MYTDSDLLPISGLQHLLFCERQWGLIHVEQQWSENRLTAEGRLLHEKTDEGADETRAGVRIVRSLALKSLRLGLSGIADVVEFPKDGSPPYPVEYKRGKAKNHDSDRVQLCAQALCLEEMTQCAIARGALFYGQPRRRQELEFSAELRQQTESLAARMHELFQRGATPAPLFLPHCKNCSLLDICEPRALSGRGSASTYFRRAIRTVLEEEGAIEP